MEDFFKRIEGIEKPIRVFYISDFDPRGEQMHINVACKIYHHLLKHGLSYNIKLKKLLLTEEQRHYYKLPSTPLKTGDRAKKSFTDTYGEDSAAELDGLEAIHPGEFEAL